MVVHGTPLTEKIRYVVFERPPNFEFQKTYTYYYLNSFAIPWLFAYLCKSKLPPPIHQLNGELQSALDWRSGPRITRLIYDTFC